MARSFQQRRAGFDALLAHIERPNRFSPPGADVPLRSADLEECGIPGWAQCADTWPEEWRRRHEALELIPAAQRGEAEGVIQRRFLRALRRLPESQRSDPKNMPLPTDRDE